MDNESEAHFYAIWLPFLMGLAKACVFPRHICSSLGDDIEVQLKDFIVTGQPVPNARYMTNRIRHVTGGFHYKNAHFTALMDKLEEKVQKHLIAHLFRLRNVCGPRALGLLLDHIPHIAHDTTSEYNMLAGVNGCEWHSGFNLQQPAVESMNTENYGNSDQERVDPSGTVDYGRIIDSGFASVTTYSTGGDWTVTCQASVNVAVNELPDESVQIGRQGRIADWNLGPSTSQCSSSAAVNKYEPIWLPMPGWPQTVSHFFNEIKQFLLALSGRKFYYVPQEEPILRKYERRDNVDQRSEKDEAELADLVAKTRRGQGTSADKKRIEKLKCQVRQSKNAKRKREAKKNELQIRMELLKALQKELGRYQKAMKSTREWIQALPDEFLRSKLEETVLAIFVGKKREENEETLVPKKVTDNKYQLQMASWKGECDILRELRELLERLIHMEDELSDERSEEVTISSMKRRSQTHLDEPATKKSTSEMKDNSLVLNINYPEEETTNEDFQWLESNPSTASSMFPEARTLPELLKIGVRVELDKEGCEEVYAERSLKAQEQEEGDQQQNDYWDVVLDKNLRNSRDTSSPSMVLSPAHNCPDAVPQMDNDNDQDYQ